ncbi:MAG: protein kinase [Rhodanobacteraceae bacterium]|nr:protein kinase [Rhodanobacteraceae bacterium]
MSPSASADLQQWFARLVELDAATIEAELEALAQTDAVLATRLRELLQADATLSDATQPLLPGLRDLRAEVWDGRVVGDWRVAECLGSGGMGTVYRAVRASPPNDVAALKLLRAGPGDTSLRRRFALERKVLQSLQHPGIARLIDAGETGGHVPYVVMELVEGEHILDYADRQRLDISRRVELLLKVCAAVAHAHARQVVHRDIKNSNILVTPQGQPKLLDFGIAKPLQAQFGTISLERTATAQRFFSPYSAAPEQIRGESTGPACDVYALGVLLYELLCGETPLQLQGASPAEVEVAITQQVPLPPSERLATLLPGVANARARQRGCADRGELTARLRGGFDRVVAKALRKHPSQRHASIERFAYDLRAACRGDMIPEPALRRFAQGLGSHRRGVMVALAIVAAAAIAWLSWRDDALSAPELAAVPVSESPGGGSAAPTPLDPASQAELLLVRAQQQWQRGDDAASLASLQQAEAHLAAAGKPRDAELQLAALRASAATRSGDFPLAAQALDQADRLAATSAERAGLAVQRARLLSARGRDAEAAALLKDVADDTLSRLKPDDVQAAQIRAGVADLDRAAVNAPAAADGADATDLAAQLEVLSRDIERARAEAGIAAPAPVTSVRPQRTISAAPVAATSAPEPVGTPPGSGDTPAQRLADEVARASALNARGEYAAAARLLDGALERQRSDPALRHIDDYRLGVLAAAIARHGQAPSAETAQQLSHELARDVWLSGEAGRARWREQAEIARRLGVERAE